ncbi:MAG: hypothetical protein HBSAPP04_13050 [Ignavibacteriaceae bacterium]|nr:MAG: hypothetical protein HBSAPP04_13050 [Ignavibacteriaceae bacterium]
MSEHSFLAELTKTGSPVIVVAGILFAIWLWSSKAYLKLYREQMKQMNETLINLIDAHSESNKTILAELTTYIHEDHKTKVAISEALSRVEVKLDSLKYNMEARRER